MDNYDHMQTEVAHEQRLKAYRIEQELRRAKRREYDAQGRRLRADGAIWAASLKPGETQWTDERVDLLKTLWTAGVPTGEIADKMGLKSRGAVTGKIRRLGLSGRIASTGNVPRPRPTPQEKTAQAIEMAAQLPENRTGPFLPIEMLGSTDVMTQCRNHPWDLGMPGAGFCAQPVSPGHSYCPQCLPRMYYSRGSGGFTAPKVGRIAAVAWK